MCSISWRRPSISERRRVTSFTSAIPRICSSSHNSRSFSTAHHSQASTCCIVLLRSPRCPLATCWYSTEESKPPGLIVIMKCRSEINILGSCVRLAHVHLLLPNHAPKQTCKISCIVSSMGICSCPHHACGSKNSCLHMAARSHVKHMMQF